VFVAVVALWLVLGGVVLCFGSSVSFVVCLLWLRHSAHQTRAMLSAPAVAKRWPASCGGARSHDKMGKLCDSLGSSRWLGCQAICSVCTAAVSLLVHTVEGFIPPSASE
jgi:hypothetical protein